MENSENIEINNNMVGTTVTPNTQDLLSLINGLIKEKQQKDKVNKKLRYVMYVRKSTKDKEHQVRSIGDQITDCRKIKHDLGLKVMKIIRERQSAKESGIRPKFTKMLDDIKLGKYDGILCWHPDRLARNMAEAGTIIDMLDKDEIKDLKFFSFYFQNDGSGKMLLGMSFVMSKEYTDHLSESINRGNRRSVAEGSGMGVNKHGYYRDKNFYYRPDGLNYSLICEAWKKKINGERLEDIAKYLNGHTPCYHKSLKIGGVVHKPWLMDKNKLSILFKDSFYTGVMKNGDNTVDLTKWYDFESAVSVEDFLKINKIDDIKKSFVTQKGFRRGDVKAHFLREFVICSDCGKKMNPVVTVKHDKKTNEVIKRYVNFRCRTVQCKRKKKGVRANKVFTYILNFLRNNQMASQDFYQHYLEELKMATKLKQKVLTSEKMAIIQENVGLKTGIEDIRKYLQKEIDIDLIKESKNDYSIKKATLDANLEKISNIDRAMSLTKEAPMSYSKFVELFKEMPNILGKIRRESLRSEIVKKVFANCTLKEEKIVSLRLNTPFNKFVPNENPIVSSGQELNLPRSVLQTDA